MKKYGKSPTPYWLMRYDKIIIIFSNPYPFSSSDKAQFEGVWLALEATFLHPGSVKRGRAAVPLLFPQLDLE